MATLVLKIICCFVMAVLFPLGIVATLDNK